MITRNEKGELVITRQVVKEETRTVKSLESLLHEQGALQDALTRIQARLDSVTATIAEVQALDEK
jgi:hypothetical protein